MSGLLPDRVRALFTDDEAARLVALRRDLHAHPELSWQEVRTQGVLERELRAAGIQDIQHVATTGLIARIPGRVPGAPVTALRGDIDALPFTRPQTFRAPPRTTA